MLDSVGKPEYRFFMTSLVKYSITFRILAERERQRAIAKERLAARKLKKYQMTAGQGQTADQLIAADENSKMEEIVKDAEGNPP